MMVMVVDGDDNDDGDDGDGCLAIWQARRRCAITPPRFAVPWQWNCGEGGSEKQAWKAIPEGIRGTLRGAVRHHPALRQGGRTPLRLRHAAVRPLSRGILDHATIGIIVYYSTEFQERRQR